MQVITIPEADAQRWEAFVEECPFTVAWQSYRWHEAVRRNYAADFYPLVAAEADGTIQGILPLYQLRGPGATSRLISVPFAVAGGLAATSPEAREALLAQAIELSNKVNAGGFTLKQYRYPVDGPMNTDGRFFNRELTLSVGADRIWSQLDPCNRSRIEAAERERLSLEYPSSRVSPYYDLLVRFMTRSGVPCPSRQWIATLLDLNMYNIALLEKDGRVVAGTMVKAFKRTVSFPFTCLSDRSQESLLYAYALYWRLIQHFAGQGFQIFHSGRMPEQGEVDAYRLGWGGEKHPYFYQYYPATEGRTEYRNKRGLKRSVFTFCWKLMPTPLAEAIGPKVVAKFP